MEKKKADYVPEHTYEKLEGILKDSTQKSKAGMLDMEGKLYGIASGYAQDFVDTSRAIGKPLDLTGMTEENVFITLTRVCAENLAQRRNSADNRMDMSKKYGYYELFALVNSLNCEGKTVEIAIQAGILIREPKLVIRSLPDSEGKIYTFDVMEAAKETVDRMIILDPKKNGGAVLSGQLSPFYTRLKKDLIDHIIQA